MKRSVLFLAFLTLLNVVLSAQKPGTIWPAGSPGKDYNLYDAKGKKDGLWIQTLKGSKNLFSKGQFKNGQPVGTWEKYYDDGALYSIQNIRTADSIETSFFHPDGKTLGSKGWYVKKKKTGVWKLYSTTGVMLAEETYKDSLLEGPSKYFYASGKLLKTEVYKAGVQEGPFIEYFENGKKRAEGTYLGGEKNGDYKAWYENGTQESFGKFIKGTMDGTWHYYNEDGEEKVAILYEKGAEKRRKYYNGTFKESYDSGIPKSEYSYEDGKKNGPFTEWYDQGEYGLEPADDPELRKQGYQRQVLKGTQMKMKGDYLNDKLEGEVIYYDEKGAITKIEVWSDGVLTSTRKAGQ